MTEEIVLLIKDIVDKAGLDISVEQIETGLSNMAPEEPGEDPWLKEVIRKIEEEQKAKGADESDGNGISMLDWGNCYVVSGPAQLEYTGRVVKRYEGDAVLLLKPDNSIVVHGPRGVNPVSYMVRAREVWSRGKNGTFTVEASTGDERLAITFLKMEGFDGLFREERLATAKAVPVAKPPSEKTALTGDEKALEARLKQLRIDLASREGITYLPAVFDNRMLYQLIRQRPQTVDDLRHIRGFGAKRVERYAASLLEALKGETSAGHINA